MYPNRSGGWKAYIKAVRSFSKERCRGDCQMIIIRFSGGLGNQMFQYALGAVLQEKYTHMQIKADLGHYKLYKVHNGFEIEKCFTCSIEKASVSEIRKASGRLAPRICINFMPPFTVNLLERTYGRLKDRTKKESFIRQAAFNSYEPALLENLRENKHYYIEGEWQNWKYFEGKESLLRNAFQFRKKLQSEQDLSYVDAICRTDSVSIHLRCGDFINSPAHDLCGRPFYEKAIAYIRDKVQNPRFFVFSDDMERAKEMFRELEPTYVCHSREDADIDMHLMSLCKHNVIPNSSFSFWAALLNSDPQKIVVCPKYFFRKENEWFELESPLGWKKLDNRDMI